MSRRHREPLSKESFDKHFFMRNRSETFAYGEKSQGYVLGFKKFGIFAPTHFAPKTLRGGYELFQALGKDEEVPAVLAVTEDLADTLEKISYWNKLNIRKEFLSYFRGEIVKKEVFYNSYQGIDDLMKGLLMEYMDESHEINDDEDNEGDENIDDFLDSDT